MELGLKNKVAVVTGSGKGIGLAVARGLAREGVHLMLCARDGKQVARNAAALRRTYRVKAVGLPVDVTRLEDLLQAEPGDIADIPQVGENAAAILEAARAEAGRRQLPVGEAPANH